MRARVLLAASARRSCSSRAGPPTEGAARRAAVRGPGAVEPGRAKRARTATPPNAAFRDPESDHSTSMGVVARAVRLAQRADRDVRAVRAAAASRRRARRWVGGLFWDGRANSLEDQARRPAAQSARDEQPRQGERGRARPARRATRARSATCSAPTSLDDADRGVRRTSPSALAAFERTADLRAVLVEATTATSPAATTLTPSELRGLAIFEDPDARQLRDAVTRAGPAPDGTPPLFTNFSYANLGVPTLPQQQVLRAAAAARTPTATRYVDHGLMPTVGDPAQDGKFRVPTLRDVAPHAAVRPQRLLREPAVHDRLLDTRDGLSSDPAVGAWAARK